MTYGHRKIAPAYDPSTDGTLEMWMDPSDTSTLTKVGGGVPVNGNTIATWASKAGTARTFAVWGANSLPTYETDAFNGLPGVQCTSQIITTQNGVTSFNSLGGLTIALALVNTVAASGGGLNLSCIDPNTGFGDITAWGVNGGAAYAANGWRVPRSDPFQSFSGSGLTAGQPLIITSMWDYANAQISIYEGGTRGPVFQSAFGSPGVTPAASGTTGAYALSFGGFAQQTGLAAAGEGSKVFCYALLWLSAKSQASLLGPHDFLRRRFGL